MNLLNASLCDAVLGEAPHGREQVSDRANDRVNDEVIGNKATLQMLAGNGIFMEQLDDAGEWFRYQELFRHLLQRRLRSTHSSEDIDAFTRRAKLWHEQHDLPEHLESPAAECATPPVAPAGNTLVVAAPQVKLWANSRPAAGEQVNSLLTYREMDVLSLLCERLTNKEIAHKLGISVETVRQHSVHVYRKLGVAGRRQAVVQAYALGLPVPPVGRVQVGSQAEGAGRPAPAGVD